MALSCPSEALLWGRSTLRSPPTFVAPGEPRELLCLCMLLFPLHAQTPSPPRCARTGLERFQASQAAPGSRRPSHSAGGTANPTGSGLDLSPPKKKTFARISTHLHSCLLNQEYNNLCQHITISDNNCHTFKRRLEHWCGLEGEEQLFSVLAERPALLSGHNELADEARTVADVIILIILGQVENVLRQQFGLRREGTCKFYFSINSFFPSIMSQLCVKQFKCCVLSNSHLINMPVWSW